MHQFTLRNRNNGFQMTLTGLGSTPEIARMRLLVFNLANVDLTVWELSN